MEDARGKNKPSTVSRTHQLNPLPRYSEGQISMPCVDPLVPGWFNEVAVSATAFHMVLQCLKAHWNNNTGPDKA